MSYIEKLINGETKPKEGQISLEDYLRESLYITKYMSPRIKATNIATYHAMFYLSYGTNGVGEFTIPWPEIGALCGNERNTGVITKNESVRERTKVLTKLGCVRISQNRTGANDFYVVRPSEIPFVKEAISKDNHADIPQPKTTNVDCYNDTARRLKILGRDQSKCMYCLATLTHESYILVHVKPKSRGGTDYKNNLVVSCRACNANKSDHDVREFLLENYRKGLLTQPEYIEQKAYINGVIQSKDTGEP